MTPFGIMVLFSLLLNIILVDGSWGQWSPWSQCSRSCDGGTRSRVKLCDDPPPRNGGLSCFGIRFEPEDCNSFPCKGKNSKAMNELPRFLLLVIYYDEETKPFKYRELQVVVQ